MPRKPTGFVAKCQCGVFTGALDYDRMDRKDVGKMLGDWLARGCIVEPRFGGEWTEHIGSCTCSPDPTSGQQEKP